MSVVPSFGETQPPSAESAESAEAQGERQGRRRNRRGGRGGRDRDEARPGGEPGSSDAAGAPTEETMAAMDAGGLPAVAEGRADEAPTNGMPRSEEGGEGRRRGRGRDRARREPMAQDGTIADGDDRHGEAPPSFGRTERSDIEGMTLEPTAGVQSTAAVQPIEARSPWVATDVMPSGTAPQPMELATPVPVATMPAPSAEPFELPLGSLEAVAEAAGLQWVNSDADKIRAVQEAMANEPPPMRVPRERKAPVVVDEGPLVLVETKKDLSQFKLPFETAQQETQGRA